MSFEIENFKPKSRNVLHTAKWLSLKEIEFEDAKGVKRKWDVCERTTRQGEIDGVDVLAIISDSRNPSKEKSLLLVRQFRAPPHSICIEFPAGLIDKGEKPKISAIRELSEETGFKGKAISSSPPLVIEPSMTNANTSFVRVDIDMEENENPVQNLEPEEFIEVLRIRFSKLWSSIQEFQKKGYSIDSKVYTFAYALQFSKDFI